MIELGCSGCSAFQDAPPANTYQQQQQKPHTLFLQQNSGQATQSSATAAATAPTTNPAISQLPSNWPTTTVAAATTITAATTTQPTIFQQQQAKLNYFNHQAHNLHQPSHLLAPTSHLLLGPNSATTSTGPNGSSAASFGLTPDARACVTATYLCVLIVNNTWLDCNLLDTLCNSGNSFNGTSASNQASSAAGEDGEEADKRREFSSPESYVHLGALESALNELIAFAGGGGGGGSGGGDGGTTIADQSGNESSGWTKPGEVYVPPTRFQLESPDNKAMPQLRPIELPDKGGGGGGGTEGGGGGGGSVVPQLYTSDSDILTQLLLYSAQSLSKGEGDLRLKLGPPDELQRQQQKQLSIQQQADLIAKANRMSDEDKSRLLEQYKTIRNSSQDRKKPPSQAQQSIVLQRQPVQNNNNKDQQSQQQPQLNSTQLSKQAQIDQQVQQQQVLQTTMSSASSLVSWVGRPFRGWSSYSFWPTELIASQSQQARVQQQQGDASEFMKPQDKQQKQMQILRPIDRTDQYNDIATNQSSLKPNLSGPQQQTFATIVFPTSESPSILASTQQQTGPPTIIVNSNNNNNKQQQLQFAADIRTQQAQQQQPVVQANSPFGDLVLNPTTVASNHFQAGEIGAAAADECKCNIGSNPAAGSASVDLLVQLASDDQFQAECRYRCQLSSAVVVAAAAAAAQSQTAQSTAPSLVEQQREQQQQQQQPAQQLVTSSTITAMTAVTTTAGGSLLPTLPATTTVSGGKMNPLDVTFILYTRYHRDLASGLAQLSGTSASNLATTAANSLGQAGEVIDLTNETTLNESRLNSSLPIKIIIHGFGSGGQRPWVTDMVYKLLDYEDVNVIVVDWEKGATLPNYVQAAGNTRLVGHKIACLIKSINAKYGLTGNSYHIIGFSLGAHVAGFAGMEIRNSTSVPRHWINRITGLDPASPLFEGYEANDRLDPSDAQFVDVIHSNGDGVLRGGFGSLQPMGHVDFYPNGGRVQVGCNSVLLSALSDIIYGKWQSLCNHRRALNFFMDSFEFNKCRFQSFNCDSYENYLKGDCFDCGFNNEKCSYMGYLANYSKGRGKMYLTTQEEAPFCANQFIIKIIGTKGYKTHWGKVEVTLVTSDGKNESFWLSSMNQQSTNELGSNQKELSQHSIQSLIVAQPTLVNFTQVLLRYTKYKGWIYSGDESWPIEKVFITDSDGQVKSFCGFNTVLESHITTRLNLEPGNCTVAE